MESIYASRSQESLRQDCYLTQGGNETYGQFACRVSGLQIRFGEPDRFLSRMSSESSNGSQGSFAEHFDCASVRPEHYSPAGEGPLAGQRYYFQMRADTAKNIYGRSNDCASQLLIEQPERQSRDRETDVKENKSILKRLLKVLIRCFIPCINIKI